MLIISGDWHWQQVAARSGSALLQTEGTWRRLRQEDAETDGEGAGGGDAEALTGEGVRVHRGLGGMTRKH